MNSLTTMHHTLFISDLHLQEDEPQITATFLDFMEHRAPHADALYILGDFFEAWIGDDDHNAFNQRIIDALQKLVESGTPIYFMRGNRDLLIGKKFAEAAKMTLLNDPCVVKLYNKSVLLSHGDILCTLDHRHQRYRKVATKPWLQKLFLMLPLSFRRKLANQMRIASRKYNSQQLPHIVDVTPEAVERIMRKHQTELMIHGHTHRPYIHEVNLEAKAAKRIVLGSWHSNGSALIYRNDGSFELETFAASS